MIFNKLNDLLSEMLHYSKNSFNCTNTRINRRSYYSPTVIQSLNDKHL
jgi:hypothetical protein